MDILGGISSIVGNVGARQQAIERSGYQLQGGYNRVGTVGGEGVPAGGFRLSESERDWLTQHNAEANQPHGINRFLGGGIGSFFGGKPATQPIPNNIRTVDEANQLVDSIRHSGDAAMADQLAAEFNQQLGGTPTATGSTDIKNAMQSDFQSMTEAAKADWARQQEGLGLLKQGQGQIEQARMHLNEGAEQVLADSKQAQEDAVNSLDMAKIGALGQLADSMRLRREVMGNFQDDTAAAFETQRGALAFRHRTEEDALRNRLAADPNFQNRPDQIEAQINNLKFNQRDEIVTAAGNLKVQYDQQRSALDMNTAQMEAQSAMAFAGETAGLAGMESGLRTHFADSIRDTEMNKASVNISLDLLERDNQIQIASYLRSMSETVVPFAPVLQMAMGLDVAIEDRANQLKWGSEAEANAAWGNLGQTLFGLGAVERQNDQIDAQNQQARQANERGWVGTGISAVSSIGGLFKPGGGGSPTPQTSPSAVVPSSAPAPAPNVNNYPGG